MLTCESALCEAAFFLGAPAAVARLLESGTIDAGFDAVAEASRLTGLLEKYPQMDWTDACIVRLSELHRQCEVLTVDERHFRVYRRFGRETIPLHLPPTSGK